MFWWIVNFFGLFFKTLIEPLRIKQAAEESSGENKSGMPFTEDEKAVVRELLNGELRCAMWDKRLPKQTANLDEDLPSGQVDTLVIFGKLSEVDFSDEVFAREVLSPMELGENALFQPLASNSLRPFLKKRTGRYKAVIIYTHYCGEDHLYFDYSGATLSFNDLPLSDISQTVCFYHFGCHGGDLDLLYDLEKLNRNNKSGITINHVWIGGEDSAVVHYNNNDRKFIKVPSPTTISSIMLHCVLQLWPNTPSAHLGSSKTWPHLNQNSSSRVNFWCEGLDLKVHLTDFSDASEEMLLSLGKNVLIDKKKKKKWQSLANSSQVLSEMTKLWKFEDKDLLNTCNVNDGYMESFFQRESGEYCSVGTSVPSAGMAGGNIMMHFEAAHVADHHMDKKANVKNHASKQRVVFTQRLEPCAECKKAFAAFAKECCCDVYVRCSQEFEGVAEVDRLYQFPKEGGQCIIRRDKRSTKTQQAGKERPKKEKKKKKSAV